MTSKFSPVFGFVLEIEDANKETKTLPVGPLSLAEFKAKGLTIQWPPADDPNAGDIVLIKPKSKATPEKVAEKLSELADASYKPGSPALIQLDLDQLPPRSMPSPAGSSRSRLDWRRSWSNFPRLLRSSSALKTCRRFRVAYRTGLS